MRKQFKHLTAAVLGLAMVFTMVFAMAANASADCRKKISLTAAALGDFSGTDEVRQKGARQKFNVSIDADPNTVYAVYVFHGSSSALAGSITTDGFGNGELDLSNANGNSLPAGVAPVCTISSVEVRDGGGNLVLSGSF